MSPTGNEAREALESMLTGKRLIEALAKLVAALDHIEQIKTHAAGVEAERDDIFAELKVITAERDAALAEVERLHFEQEQSFWTHAEWEAWSNDLSNLIPEDDECGRSNVDGSQESIVFDCFKSYLAERDALRAKVAAVEDVLGPTDNDWRWDDSYMRGRIRAALAEKDAS